MTVGTRALIGLAAGLTAGIAVAASGRPGLATVGAIADVVGTLWINAILMTILPLVVSKLVVSIGGQADGGAIGRLGRRAAVTFLALLTAAAACSAVVMPVVFAYLPIDNAASAAPAGPGRGRCPLTKDPPARRPRTAGDGKLAGAPRQPGGLGGEPRVREDASHGQE